MVSQIKKGTLLLPSSYCWQISTTSSSLTLDGEAKTSSIAESEAFPSGKSHLSSSVKSNDLKRYHSSLGEADFAGSVLGRGLVDASHPSLKSCQKPGPKNPLGPAISPKKLKTFILFSPVSDEMTGKLRRGSFPCGLFLLDH